MKTLIIYTSIHHKNTEKIAKKMANILEAKLLTPDEADTNTFKEYDLIGFGSGIYHRKFHENLLNF
ncbi:MAG: flavodoxin, partial [Candidatus Altiarchaeales archaeon HGW-Altiarchaeales-2]